MSLKKDTNYYSGNRIEMLKYIPNSASIILDVGCGSGRFGEQLMQRKMEVWGVEPNLEAASRAKSKLSRVLSGTIEDIMDQIPEYYFDIIVFNDVLEHLIDPWEIMSKLKSKLKHGGKVIASIPNFRYVTNLFQLLVRKDLEYCDSGIMDSTHLRFFTMKSMQRLFLSSGYIIEKFEGIEATRSLSGLVLASLINFLTLMSHKDIYYKQFVFIAS